MQHCCLLEIVMMYVVKVTLWAYAIPYVSGLD